MGQQLKSILIGSLFLTNRKDKMKSASKYCRVLKVNSSSAKQSSINLRNMISKNALIGNVLDVISGMSIFFSSDLSNYDCVG